MLTNLDQNIIRRLQEDIPLVAEPYKVISEELGIDEDILLERIKYFYESDILKRLGAIIYHIEAGYKANAMVVWNVPKESVEFVGKLAASIPAVSHCYERVTNDRWKYNLFTMVHGRSEEECEKTIDDISNNINIQDYRVLYSVRELKKSSARYF